MGAALARNGLNTPRKKKILDIILIFQIMEKVDWQLSDAVAQGYPANKLPWNIC